VRFETEKKKENGTDHSSSEIQKTHTPGKYNSLQQKKRHEIVVRTLGAFSFEAHARSSPVSGLAYPCPPPCKEGKQKTRLHS
jgi:hypothetical protein